MDGEDPPFGCACTVALTEDRDSVMAAGHHMLDFYATIPFYASMLANAGLPPTIDQHWGV